MIWKYLLVALAFFTAVGLVPYKGKIADRDTFEERTVEVSIRRTGNRYFVWWMEGQRAVIMEAPGLGAAAAIAKNVLSRDRA